MIFSAIFEQINENQNKRDQNNDSKLQLYRDRTELKFLSQEYRIYQASRRLKEETNNRRITNLTKMIELAQKEVMLYKDIPDMKAEAAEILQKYYTEFEVLKSQL